MSINLSKGLVGFWPLSQERYNSVTKRVDNLSAYPNIHGTSANAASFVADRMGQGNRAMEFVATNSDYINIDDSLSILSNTTKGSWCAWVKPVDATPTGAVSFISYGDTNAAENMMLYISTDGKLNGFFRITGTTRWHISTDSAHLVDNTWAHIILIQNGTEPILYINGVNVPQTFITSVDKTKWFNDASGLDNGRIGDRNYNNAGESLYIDGALTDVRIYNRALSQEEITYLYESYNPKLAIGSLYKGLVLDTPLNTTWYNPGAALVKDRTPYCISPGTRGFFGSGFTRADEVKEGDTILQSDGKFGAIRKIVPSHFKGELIRIKARGVPAMKLTPEHKILVINGGRISNTRRVRIEQRFRKKTISEFDFTPEWIDTKDLHVGDYLIIPKPKLDEKDQIIQPMKHMYVKDYILDEFANGATCQELIDDQKYPSVLNETIKTYYTIFKSGAKRKIDAKYFKPQIFDEEWAEIFGWWIAEGSFGIQPTRGRWDVVFTLGYSENEEAERIQYLINKKTGKMPNINAHGSSITITTHNKSFVKFLCDNFGRGAINKKIPDWILDSPLNVIKAFLVAYNKGDGCITGGNTKGYYDAVGFQTISPNLVKGVTLLLMKLGISPNIFDMNTNGFCEIVQGKIYNQNPAWDIRISGHDCLVLYSDIKISSQKQTTYLQDNSNFYVRISKLELEKYEGTVYDFETETHTLGMPFVIHNSNHGAVTGATVGAKWTSFNGTTDNVRIPDSVSLSPVNAMSAFVWVKGAAQNGKGVLSHYDSAINKRAFFLTSHSTYTNKLHVVISDDGTLGVGHRKNYYSSIISFDNTPHLIGFTFGTGTLKLYIDGIEDTNTTKTYDDAITTIHNSTADIMIGCYLNSGTPTSLFTGYISKPHMWKRAITPAEALLWFDQTRGIFL